MKYIKIEKKDLTTRESLADPVAVYKDPDHGEIMFFGVCSDLSDSEEIALQSLEDNMKFIYDIMIGDTCYRIGDEIKVWSEVDSDGIKKYVAYHQVGAPGVTLEKARAWHDVKRNKNS